MPMFSNSFRKLITNNNHDYKKIKSLDKITFKVGFKYLIIRNMSQSNLEDITIQPRKNKIAIIQITCTGNKDENFEIAKNLIKDAKNKGARVNI